jgi:hypothetical protein
MPANFYGRGHGPLLLSALPQLRTQRSRLFLLQNFLKGNQWVALTVLNVSFRFEI